MASQEFHLRQFLDFYRTVAELRLAVYRFNQVMKVLTIENA
jgi:hypothetical protein